MIHPEFRPLISRAGPVELPRARRGERRRFPALALWSPRQGKNATCPAQNAGKWQVTAGGGQTAPGSPQPGAAGVAEDRSSRAGRRASDRTSRAGTGKRRAGTVRPVAAQTVGARQIRSLKAGQTSPVVSLTNLSSEGLRLPPGSFPDGPQAAAPERIFGSPAA